MDDTGQVAGISNAVAARALKQRKRVFTVLWDALGAFAQDHAWCARQVVVDENIRTDLIIE